MPRHQSISVMGLLTEWRSMPSEDNLKQGKLLPLQSCEPSKIAHLSKAAHHFHTCCSMREQVPRLLHGWRRRPWCGSGRRKRRTNSRKPGRPGARTDELDMEALPRNPTSHPSLQITTFLICWHDVAHRFRLVTFPRGQCIYTVWCRFCGLSERQAIVPEYIGHNILVDIVWWVPSKLWTTVFASVEKGDAVQMEAVSCQVHNLHWPAEFWIEAW